jgi:hypothetical protein
MGEASKTGPASWDTFEPTLRDVLYRYNADEAMELYVIARMKEHFVKFTSLSSPRSLALLIGSLPPVEIDKVSTAISAHTSGVAATLVAHALNRLLDLECRLYMAEHPRKKNL